MSEDPVRVSQLGDRRWNDKWEDLSLSTMHERFQRARDVLKELHVIDCAQFSAEDQASYVVFEYNTSNNLEGESYNWYLVRTNAFNGIQTVEGLGNDYNDWLGRMHHFPAYMDQNIGLMREGIKDHVLPPKVIGEKIWRDSSTHGFHKPFKKMPPSFSKSDKRRLTAGGQQFIKTEVLPAFQCFAISCKRITCPARLSRSTPGRFAKETLPTPIWCSR